MTMQKLTWVVILLTVVSIGVSVAALICTVLGAVGERQVKPGSFPIAALTDAARRTEAVLGSKVISW